MGGNAHTNAGKRENQTEFPMSPLSMTRDKEGLLTVRDAEASPTCWTTCDQRRPPSSSPFLAHSRLLVLPAFLALRCPPSR